MKSVNKVRTLAILGGTFDPVHIGHLRIAIRLREAGFDEVIMVPNKVPPHREQPQASGEQRLTMLQLATRDLDGISASDIELRQEGTSYSARTVTQLKQQHPEIRLTWAMGTDAWNSFDRWHTPEEILKQCNLLVITRPGDSARKDGWLGTLLRDRHCNLSGLMQKTDGAVCHQAWPELDISASDLRRSLMRGDNIAFLTPDPVLEYIKQQQLYR